MMGFFQEAYVSHGGSSKPLRPMAEQSQIWSPAGVGRSADVLSHEATFTADMYAKARIAQHSTAPMAGNFARQLGAQTLVLTHFSGRFTEFRGKVKP